MQPVTMRRVVGLLLAIAAGAYWYTALMEIDINALNLPDQVEAPAFWLGYAAVTAWCLLPQLIRVPGATDVNLLPTTQGLFQEPLTVGGPEHGEPFQMNGVWYCQWQGAFLMWDQTSQEWIPAAMPGG